jgi:hypothetical protein
MLKHAEIDQITGIVKSASASIEARFMDIGVRLGTAIDTIGTLTQTFDRLGTELESENLRDATRQLSDIIAAIATLANVQDDKQALFGQLADLISSIQQRVPQMGKAVNSIGMLAINTRIEAANIGDAGLDFAGFTSEIGRTLCLAQTSLTELTGELGGVGSRLRAATTSQLALAHHRQEALQSVPVQLRESMDMINSRGQRVVAAATAVTQKSRQVAQSISDAVMALQVGDITRQRLEHVEFGLGIIAEILSPPDDQKHGDWSALDVPQRQALGNLCGRLLSAQLIDTADEFDREVGRIFSSIQDIAVDSDDIMQLGTSTVGASGDQRGTFLGKVEDQVSDVEVLLKGAAAARQQADTVVSSVSDATTRLVAHTSNLRSLEEDIRIMGLNMSLKCGRLGGAGLPLMAVAQELRAYSNHIATEAGAITVRLDGMVAIAQSLSGRDQDQDKSVARTANVMAVMANTIARLKIAGETLSEALRSLARETGTVASLLRDTAASATVHEELGRLLRQAAVDLKRAMAVTEPEDDITTPESKHMLGRLLRSYTMERERIVHDREFPGRAGAAASAGPSPPISPAAPAEFEDVFF